MEEIRLGIIGSGFMGRTHAETVRRYVKGARIVAVTGGTRAVCLAADYKIDMEDSVESLVNRNDINGVIITTPQSVHAHQTIQSAERGKHVLVEKPIAVNLDECDAMITTCQQAGVNLMVAQSQRYREGNLAAKEVLNRGEIGRILMVEDLQISVGGLDLLPLWQSKRENLGTLIGHGVHNLDRLRWFLEDEAEWVASVTTNFTQNAPVETSAMLLLKFRKGTAATFWCTYEAPIPGFPASYFRLRLLGEHGLLDVDSFGLTQLGKGDRWEVLYEQPKFDFRSEPFSPYRMEAYSKQDQEFVNSIIEKRPPAVTGKDGRAAVEIALAAYESHRTGRIVYIPQS